MCVMCDWLIWPVPCDTARVPRGDWAGVETTVVMGGEGENGCDCEYKVYDDSE